MDQIISKLYSIPFGELNYCIRDGIMYQRDMSVSIPYAESYFEDYVQKENTDIANKLNAERINMARKYCSTILDIGVGSGEFIKKAESQPAEPLKVYGYDINPIAVDWLKERMIYLDPYEGIPDEVEGLSFWDVLEHIPEPSKLLAQFKSGKYAFISMPIFTDLLKVRMSKHYKPNEHYYYYTANGLITMMSLNGFSLVEMGDGETRAGRQDIITFVFRKD